MSAISHMAFLRHGEISGAGLSPHGRRQAELLGQQLAKLELRSDEIRIWSSPARRARETAGVVAMWLNQPEVHEDPRLWTGDGPTIGFYGDFKLWQNWLRVEQVKGGLLVVVAHLELGSLACDLPSVFNTSGPTLHTPGRGQGFLFSMNKESGRHCTLP